MRGNGEQSSTQTPAVGAVHAAGMFFAALVFLAVVAAVVQWWNSTRILEHDSRFTMRLMVVIWTPFVIEALLGWILNPRLRGNAIRFALVSLVPPFRIGYSTYSVSDSIWLPRLGWRRKDRHLFEHLERVAAIPMLVIALMILPLLGIEFLLKEKVSEMPWLSLSLDVSAAFIWFAFALEYIVMMSVAENKIAYGKKHWLNLLIIVLPLIAFLRGFQAVRAFRVARAGKLLRVYRLRTVMIRAYQALVALSAIERILNRDPEKYLKKLERVHDEKQREIEALRLQMEGLRKEIEKQRAEVSEGPVDSV